MSSWSHLKCFRLPYHCTANIFILRTVIATRLAGAVLTKLAQRIAAAHETVSQSSAIRPIHLLVVVLFFVMATIYLALRPRAVYLVDYACFRPNSTFRYTKASFPEHARLTPSLDDSSISFIANVLEHSGMSDQTCAPAALRYIEPYCGLDEARAEAELVIFSAIDDLLSKTCIDREAINALIINCNVFCSVPSISDMIVNRYKLRGGCHGTKGEKDMCVVGGINNYTAALQDSSSPYNRTESLLFLSHFLGDIHQPMHCGRLADLGGNTIVVTWYNTTKTNLHKVWDVYVIETAMNRFYKDDMSTMINAIKLNLTNEWCREENQWAACYTRTTTCADKYAEESAELSCPAYVVADHGSNLEDEYFFKALPVVQKRIAQGGVRLAAILNRIFSGKNDDRIQSS
ncbi:hypothetical protein ZWY2020_012492 [Hordeum vulgare]|nr:hypothetical protein ZWY2020_012492 [Hordeum vulgare]